MGRKNDELSWFLNRPVILADFFNGCLYGGQKIILPEELAEIQKVYHEPIHSRNGRTRRSRRERDVAGLFCRSGHFVLLAVENQNNPNLCMPLRCMEYDVEDFSRQLRRLKRQHQQNNDLKTHYEYLSGIAKTDRLIPVVTIVFYHGEGNWDAPESFREMLDMKGLDKTLSSLHPDYHLRIIRISDLKEENFESGLRELIGMMKRKNDKAAMQEYYLKNESRFRNMDDETYDLICTMINQKTLAAAKTKYKNSEKETVDMCKAIDDMVKDGKAEGIRIGEERGKRLGEKEGKKLGQKLGEDKLAQLVSRLIKDGRIAELSKASESSRTRQKLYREYGLNG